jgi:hypothetical protein
MNVEVRRLEAGDRPALAAFLAAEGEATAFHRPEWHEVIRATYGHECDYWVAFCGSEIAGVFPVVHVRAPLLGAKMVAMAYQMYSGAPIGRPESFAPLVDAAADRAKQQGVKYLEIRHHEAAGWLEPLGFEAIESGLCTQQVPLTDFSLKSIRRNHRRSVNAAADAGLVVESTGSIEGLRTFRDMYIREGRSVGAPQAGWSFFEKLHALAGDCYRLYLAKLDGRVIGAMIVIRDDRMVFARNSAYSTPEALSVNAGAALYWAALSDAAGNGCTGFNCGLSWVGDKGLIHWKEGWGGETKPVHLYALPIRSKVPAPGGYFEGYRLAKAVWRRLPLPVVDAVGHAVTRWIG